MPNKNIKERLVNAFEQEQEPKDRLWAAIFVLVGLVLLLGLITVLYHESTQSFQTEGRGLGYERGAIECQQNILDDDRVGGLPGYCGKPEVLVFYPPELCDEYFPTSTICGSQWTEVS
jgi:hypothetical protein